MKTYLVKGPDGRFLGMFGHWLPEFPDAKQFRHYNVARNAAKKVGGVVWENYGLEDEQQVWP